MYASLQRHVHPHRMDKEDSEAKALYQNRAYIHTFMHAYIHAYIDAYIRTYIPTYIHTHINTYIHDRHKYIHAHITFLFCVPSSECTLVLLCA